MLGETTVRWTPSRAAVVAYAQYNGLGQVLPLVYDQTVLTRWGVGLAANAPTITVTASPAIQGTVSQCGVTAGIVSNHYPEVVILPLFLRLLTTH